MRAGATYRAGLVGMCTALAVLSGCGDNGPGEGCGDGEIGLNEQCDGDDLGGETCQSQGFAGGDLACASNCTFDTNGCIYASQCGDDLASGAEVCDGTDLMGETCISQGFAGGSLSCEGDCSGFDTSGCTGGPTCGNNSAEAPEVCDGTDLVGEDCASQTGSTCGNLTCLPDCTGYDTSDCTCGGVCGDNVADIPQEACDGTDLLGTDCASLGFSGGTLACLADCTDFDTSGCDPGVFEPIYRTEYETGQISGTPVDAITWLVAENLATGPNSIGSPVSYSIYYEDGTPSDRYARLIDDPTQPGNQVLHYWLQNATVPSGANFKGRIQSDIYGVAIPELYSRQRLYLHPDWAHYLSADLSSAWWGTAVIHEMWFGANWEGHANPARISLSLWPDAAAGELRLYASCDTTLTWESFWEAANMAYAIPVGEWMTIEIAYRMGNASQGRFIVKIQADGETSPTTVFDVTNWTYSPYADQAGGTGPVPLTHWNPQKIYSSDVVLHHIRDSGGVAQAYWDDFEFANYWPPGW